MRFYSLDEGFKSSSYLPETLLDPEIGHAFQANKAAFNKALNTEGDLWSWLEGTNNRVRLARFGAAMNGAKNITSLDAQLYRLSSDFELLNWQGMRGISSPRTRWLSTSGVALARSHWYSRSITRTFASLSRIARL